MMAPDTQTAEVGIWEYEVATGNVIWDSTMFKLYGQALDVRFERHGSKTGWVHPDDAARANEEFRKAVDNGDQFLQQYRIVRGDGTVRTLQSSGHVFRDQSGEPIRMVGVSSDITPLLDVQMELEKTNEILEKQSETLRSLVHIDGLTGGFNRRRFDEVLELEWNRCRRSEMSLSIFMIDVDHFKAFNDTYGHQAGDMCLVSVTEVLKGILKRAEDFVARYGGEEFVVLVSGLTPPQSSVMAKRLIEEVAGLAIPHEASPTSPIVTISLGLFVALPTHHDHPTDALRRADTLLYRAKSEGRNRFVTEG